MYVKLAIAGILALLLVALGWKIELHGYNRRVAEEQVQTIQDLRKNEIAERNLQGKIDEVKQEKDDEIHRINTRHSAALDRLRKRPVERNLSEAAGACPGTAGPGLPGQDGQVLGGGATGRALAGPDTAWLEGEAARGNRLRAALAECYRALDAFRAAQSDRSPAAAPGPALMP